MADAKTKTPYAVKIGGEWYVAVKRKSGEYGLNPSSREVWGDYRTTALLGDVGAEEAAVPLSAAPQPAASDVPHDVVRGLTVEMVDKLEGDSLDAICEVIGAPKQYNDGKSAMRDWFLGRLRRALATPAPSTSTEDWRDDPSADDRWNAGVDFAQTQLCAVLKVDPNSITWDGGTETLDGDVQSAICKVLTAWAGDDWMERPSSTEEALRAENARLREALTKHHAWHLASEPDAEGVGGAEAYCESSLFDLTTTALSALSR